MGMAANVMMSCTPPNYALSVTKVGRISSLNSNFNGRIPLRISAPKSVCSYKPVKAVMIAKREEELKEIRTKTTEEINDEEVDLKGELVMLRIKKATRHRSSKQASSVECGEGNNSIRAAKKGNPPIAPGIMTPAGPLDLMSVLLRSRIVFIGQPINPQVAQRVISQLMTLAANDPDADILMYLNCPGGSIYSVLAIYDCMSWIKPKVGTVCFGVAASQAALLLAGGEKGMRYAMPNSRIMIHQPQGGCGGNIEDVWRQVNELVTSRDKLDKMYVAFTGQPLEKVQRFTDRDYFFSAAEAMEFGLIDGVLETEY